MHTITIDFVVALPVVPSTGTSWHLKGFDSFDAVMLVTYKMLKRSLLIPRYTTYTMKDWASVFTC